MEHSANYPARGRGTSINPVNRFEPLHVEPDAATLAEDTAMTVKTQYYKDTTRSILSTNDSPDVGFTYSINPYRGCEHGCIYCYARPTHEYLGLSAGLDFESRIFVKTDAANLLRKELAAKSWKPDVIVMSGVTDPYQPIEKRLQITRACLQVLADCLNPVCLITKNHLITRDVDLLKQLAEHNAVQANISVTTLDTNLAKNLEPRASLPALRLKAVQTLSENGIPVNVMVAPIIPGLTDIEIPAILKAAYEHGATSAAYTVVRLPYAVKDVFADWLEHHFPDRKKKVLGRLLDLRGGKINDPNFKSRMHGHGPFAEQIHDVFTLWTKKLGMNKNRRPLSTAAFIKPNLGKQLLLWDLKKF